MRWRGHLRRASGAAPGTGDRGETLVELLVTITIMAVGIIGILVAITNAFLISDRLGNGSRANLAAQEQAELIKEADYVNCADAGTYDLITDDPDHDLDGDWEVEIVEVSYWDGDESASTVGWSNDRPACLTNGDNKVQQLVVEVRASGRGAVRKQVVVVKRDQTCPASAPSEVVAC